MKAKTSIQQSSMLFVIYNPLATAVVCSAEAGFLRKNRKAEIPVMDNKSPTKSKKTIIRNIIR